MDESKQTSLVRGVTLFADALRQYSPGTWVTHIVGLLAAVQTVASDQADFEQVLRELRDRIDKRLTEGHW